MWLNDRTLFFLNSVLTLLNHCDNRDMDEDVVEMARMDVCASALSVDSALYTLLERDLLTTKDYSALKSLFEEALGGTDAPEKLTRMGLNDVKEALLDLMAHILYIPEEFVLPEPVEEVQESKEFP